MWGLWRFAASAVITLVVFAGDVVSVVLLLAVGVVLLVFGAIGWIVLALLKLAKGIAVATRELFSPASAVTSSPTPADTPGDGPVPVPGQADATDVPSWMRDNRERVETYAKILRDLLSADPSDSILVGAAATVEYWLKHPEAITPEGRTKSWAAINQQHRNSSGISLKEVKRGFQQQADELLAWAQGIQPPRMAA